MEQFIEKLIGRLEEKTWYDGPKTAEDIAEISAYKNAIQIVKELAEEHNGGWIPCSERFPMFCDTVLICTKIGGITVAHLTIGKRFCDTYMNIVDDVIAWQPLPEPYKAKGE